MKGNIGFKRTLIIFARLISCAMFCGALLLLSAMGEQKKSLGSLTGGACSANASEAACGDNSGTSGQACNLTNPCVDKCYAEKNCYCTGPADANCKNDRTRDCEVDILTCDEDGEDPTFTCVFFASGWSDFCGSGYKICY